MPRTRCACSLKYWVSISSSKLSICNERDDFSGLADKPHPLLLVNVKSASEKFRALRERAEGRGKRRATVEEVSSAISGGVNGKSSSIWSASSVGPREHAKALRDRLAG